MRVMRLAQDYMQYIDRSRDSPIYSVVDGSQHERGWICSLRLVRLSSSLMETIILYSYQFLTLEKKHVVRTLNIPRCRRLHHDILVRPANIHNAK